jgi:hypothetical protein
MCKKLKALFRRHSAPSVLPLPTRPAEQPPKDQQLMLELPHPEEARNPDATMENVNIDTVLNQWMTDWRVPSEFWVYWKTKIVTTLRSPLIIKDEYGQPKEVPAASYAVGAVRYLDLEPQWLNPGVIAHEQAHNAYALLTEQQKKDFAALYNPLINTDPLI